MIITSVFLLNRDRSITFTSVVLTLLYWVVSWWYSHRMSFIWMHWINCNVLSYLPIASSIEYYFKTVLFLRNQYLALDMSWSEKILSQRGNHRDARTSFLNKIYLEGYTHPKNYSCTLKRFSCTRRSFLFRISLTMPLVCPLFLSF